MLAHVTSKLKPVESPVFSAYPLEVAPPPWSFSRFFGGAQAEYSPDLTVFALDHPAFGFTPDSLWERLAALHEAYSGFRVGEYVVLVEPDDDRVVKMELVELGEDECKVALANFGSMVHMQSRCRCGMKKRTTPRFLSSVIGVFAWPLRMSRFESTE